MIKRDQRIDVLDQLKTVLDNSPGTGNSDVNVFAIEHKVPYFILAKMYDEILRLRNQ